MGTPGRLTHAQGPAQVRACALRYADDGSAASASPSTAAFAVCGASSAEGFLSAFSVLASADGLSTSTAAASGASTDADARSTAGEAVAFLPFAFPCATLRGCSAAAPSGASAASDTRSAEARLAARGLSAGFCCSGVARPPCLVLPAGAAAAAALPPRVLTVVLSEVPESVLGFGSGSAIVLYAVRCDAHQ